MDDQDLAPSIERLKATSWCRPLFESPAWTPTRTASRVAKPSGEDSYFAETLGTQRTVRSCMALRPTEESKNGLDGIYYEEIRVILELGDGVNGYPQIAHGGFVVTMLDEAMGMLLQLNTEVRIKKAVRPDEGMSFFTAYLNTSYKKPVPTPGTILCTAKVTRRERSKVYLRATVEDGKGTVLTVGEGMFVEVKSKL